MPAAWTCRCIVRYAPGLFIRCDSLEQPLSCGMAVGPLCRSEVGCPPGGRPELAVRYSDRCFAEDHNNETLK
jgi:hypothetical protein